MIVGQPGLDAFVGTCRGLDVPRADVGEAAAQKTFVFVEEDVRRLGGAEEHEILAAPGEVDAARSAARARPIDDSGEASPRPKGIAGPEVRMCEDGIGHVEAHPLPLCPNGEG